MRKYTISVRETKEPILRPYRDYERRGSQPTTIPYTMLARIYFLDGDIDGGEISGMGEAMDYLDVGLDGGVI